MLDLYNTRFAFNNLGSLDPRKLRIKGIFDESGARVPFEHVNDEVAVGLPSPLVKGAPVKLRFELEGDILYRPGGDNFWELGVEPWFPQPDLMGQYYTVHATVKVKKPFVPFAPGKTIRRVVEDDFNVLETRIEKPVQFMVVLAGKYAYEEEAEPQDHRLRGASDLKGLEATWQSRAKEATDVAPIPLANRIRSRSDSFAASGYRTSLLYSKGPWLLDVIRREIGDKPFLVFLNSTQATFRWKFGSMKMVQQVLEAVTKKDWKPFFDDYSWGTGMPK